MRFEAMARALVFSELRFVWIGLHQLAHRFLPFLAGVRSLLSFSFPRTFRLGLCAEILRWS